jgi:hypothetical protein
MLNHFGRIERDLRLLKLLLTINILCLFLVLFKL